MGTTLILIGIGCMIAAIVGGGIKLHQLEVGTVKSVKRQIVLFLFGLVVALLGAGVNAGPQSGGKGEEKGNQQEPVGPGPVDNGAAPDVNEMAPVPLGSTGGSDSSSGGDGRIARTTLNIAGRWSVEGTEVIFRQNGSLLFVSTQDGDSGTGTLIGSEARWRMSGEGMGTIDCRAEVMEGQQVIAGACTQQGGETLPIRLDRL
jgi:hypothetical protein